MTAESTCPTALGGAFQLESRCAQLVQVGVQPLVELVCGEPPIVTAEVFGQQAHDGRAACSAVPCA